VQLNPTDIFFYGTAWTAIWGAIVWFGKDLVSQKRDRKKRKTTFLAFLKEMEIEVGVGFHPGPTHSRVAQQFSDRRPKFAAQVVMMEQDFKDEKLARFEELATAISGTTPGQVNSKEGNQKLLDAIRALTTFVRAN
jgi:hypothetical protein